MCGKRQVASIHCRYRISFRFNFCSEIWNLGTYCRTKQLEYQAKGMHNRRACVPGRLLANAIQPGDVDVPVAKRVKLIEDPNVITSSVAFFRAHYTHKDLPKLRIHAHAMKKCVEQPVYKTQQEDKLFRSVLTLDGIQYASTYWEKNKRFAEQGAALVAMLHLGLIDEKLLIKNGSILK